MTQLWLNAPEGYPIAQEISQDDTGQLKSFIIGLTPDEEMQESVRQMTHEEVLQWFADNNFTFDEEWFGARIPDWMNPDGTRNPDKEAPQVGRHKPRNA